MVTKFQHPKFYPTWVLLFLMWLLAKMPFRIQRLVANFFGFLFYHIAKKRKRIASINISLCFANKTKLERKRLLVQHFKALGAGIIATSNSFYLSKKRIQKICDIKGGKHLEAAFLKQKPIILLAGHFTSMIFTNSIVVKYPNITFSFRPQNNLLFDDKMRKNNNQVNAKMVSIKSSATMIKTLKSGAPLWYAPDQDLGIKKSVFAPFFNIPTATALSTAKLAQLTDAQVLPILFYQKNNRYICELSPALKNYPSSNKALDASKTNAILETQVRKCPEQYLWIHKRFKTRPKGEKSFY